MSSAFFPSSMEEFYAEARFLRGSGAEDGRERDRDIYYAEKFMGFARIPVPVRAYNNGWREDGPRFNYIWNRKDSTPGLAYIIAPDTRVPAYTRSLGDALELAIATGMKTLPVPSTCGYYGEQEIIEAILAHCDSLEGERA